jgi:hypothetical protein
MTERQLNLLRKAEQKLAAANTLLAQGFAEDAVSRAYYAMFYVAEAFLDAEGWLFKSCCRDWEFGRLLVAWPDCSHFTDFAEAQAERLGDYEEVVLSERSPQSISGRELSAAGRASSMARPKPWGACQKTRTDGPARWSRR